MLFWVYFSDSQERNLSGYSQQTMDLSPITPDSPLCEPFYPPTQFILPDDPDDETIASMYEEMDVPDGLDDESDSEFVNCNYGSFQIPDRFLCYNSSDDELQTVELP